MANEAKVKQGGSNKNESAPAASGEQGPGVVLSGGHGPRGPVVSHKPIDKLRSVLGLSMNVPEVSVILEAADRIVALQSGIAAQKTFRPQPQNTAVDLRA